ncbi:hypothetical protein VN97_g7289 [Penicillium thymicola]|uniref:Uncharacterized protein n=1 Tax=Penicillium thymicola TaxID=293382 RepID=A0AAI9TF83_PENTH|nr:hypothetical protein VN97_g7289 [Penicillium thymicola]
MPTKTNPKKAVESAAPALNTTQHHTNSSALHKIYFAGDLQPWPGFLGAVQASHENHAWRQQTLGYTLRARDPYTCGSVEVGDENGMQGRFQKFFGDILNSIFESQSTTQQNIDLRFADFKCISSTYSGIPDVILKDSNHTLKIVGELKAPWIVEHHIRPRIANIDLLREILAQPIKYMQDLGCMYGFLSTYEETIFLRQVVDNSGIWRVEYSPVVLASTSYDRLMTTPPVVSVRQCFFHVGLNALNQGPVNNTSTGWIVGVTDWKPGEERESNATVSCVVVCHLTLRDRTVVSPPSYSFPLLP